MKHIHGSQASRMEESTKPARQSPITPSDDLVVDLVVALQQTTNKIDMLQAENLALKAQLGAFATKEQVPTSTNPLAYSLSQTSIFFNIL